MSGGAAAEIVNRPGHRVGCRCAVLHPRLERKAAMAELIFSFLGVCTYFPTFQTYDPTPEAPPRRMLLVNAGKNAIKRLEPLGVPIDPHTASVQIFHEIIKIDGPEEAPFPIDSTQTITMSDKLGFRIWVEGATGPFQSKDTQNLPSLVAQLSGEATFPLPDSLIFDANPETASVYVDIYSGTLSAFWLPVNDSGMGITTLTITTPDDEIRNEIRVKFRQFRSQNEWTVHLKPRIVPLGSAHPAGIVIKNMPTKGLKDYPADFYLQYLAVTPIPIGQVKPVPHTLKLPKSPFSYGLPQKTSVANQDADPGCSNSHYP
jgi:hypothetical protein